MPEKVEVLRLPAKAGWGLSARHEAFAFGHKRLHFSPSRPSFVWLALLRRLDVPKLDEQQQVIGDLQRAAEDQWRGRPRRQKQRPGKSRAQRGGKAPWNGGEARRGGALGLGYDRHDI